ncbi:right-handed parallel beta-helix repeat-containing protein [Echinicola shivajiensis]|uniref:right-handed parallel beta-helix repeat-containing protein n=1 Tax=Echinicola shivajiensis TaxID=1035916 RepID=UPI001BFCCFC3|nr:right-handed parallel beta-helix repeat-containing protein [Echinicola shivajiensis]
MRQSTSELLFNNLLLAIVFLVVLSGQNLLNAQTIIRLEDYGVEANSYQNAVQGIQAALKEASKHESSIIKFPGGRLDLWPEGAIKKEYYISNTTESDTLSKEKSIGILLEGLQNVTLEGNGTLIVSHGKMIHLAIDHSRNIKVKDIAFDYERPTMSEFEVEKLGDDFAIVKVNKDSKHHVENGKVTWYGEGWKAKHLHVIKYRPDQETMHYEKSKFMENSEAVDLGDNRLLFRGFDFKGIKLKEGEILSFRDTYRDCVGLLNNFSQDLTFENISLHYLHGLGMVSQFSKNIHVNGIHAEPRASTQRVIAGFADFLHFSGCSGEITIENSLFSGSHDDPVNIHGTHLRVINNDQNKIIVRFMHHQTWNLMAFEAGDSIGFVDNNNLSIYDYAVVKEVSKINPKELELTLDREAPEQLGEKHCVENITKSPSVLIRNNRFEHTNTRGLLLTTRRKAVIENNVFYRTGMHAILIANDCNFWYESGPVKDVTIRNNQFIECGYNSYPESYAIAIKPEVLEFSKGKYVHRNIKILDNEFVLANGALFTAKATEGLVFKDNTIKNGTADIVPPTSQPFISIEHCIDVQIQSNNFSTYKGGKRLQLKEMSKKAIHLGKDQDLVLEEE